MNRVLVLCALVACGNDSPTGPLAYHVTHYDYTFDVETRASHAEVTLAVDTAGDCFDIPFRADAPASATIDGEPVSAAADGVSKLSVCGSGYDKGSSIKLGLDQQIKAATLSASQVGYSITKDTDGNTL